MLNLAIKQKNTLFVTDGTNFWAQSPKQHFVRYISRKRFLEARKKAIELGQEPLFIEQIELPENVYDPIKSLNGIVTYKGKQKMFVVDLTNKKIKRLHFIPEEAPQIPIRFSMNAIVPYVFANQYHIDWHEKGHFVETLYVAGNSPYDSQQIVSVENGVSLETLTEFALITAREMAIERFCLYFSPVIDFEN